MVQGIPALGSRDMFVSFLYVSILTFCCLLSEALCLFALVPAALPVGGIPMN